MATKRYYLAADRTERDLGVGSIIAATVSIGSDPPADGTWTDWVEFDWRKPFNLSISGTFDGVVTLQRSLDDGVTWFDVYTLSDANVETMVDTVEAGVLWRAGQKNGERTSGTAVIRISQ
jgi:hypothetical protein